jgi:hypothetical protein
MNNVIPFPSQKRSLREQIREQVFGKRHADHFLALGNGYDCRVLSASSVSDGEYFLFPKDIVTSKHDSPDHLLLNVLRKDETVVASVVVNVTDSFVEGVFYKFDGIYTDDSSAVARLLSQKEWRKRHRMPDENFIYASDGRCHAFRTMPDTLSIHGDLWIKGADSVRFPETLILTGDLTIDSSHVTRIPSYLFCRKIYVVHSWLPSVASIVKADQLDIENSAVDKICSIGNIKGDVAIRELNFAAKAPNALKVGGDLTFSPDSLSDLHSGITVMGHIHPNEPFETFPWATDFLGRVLRPGDFVKFLNLPRIITRDGQTISLPLTGYCARFKGTDSHRNLLLAIEDEGYAGADEILATINMVLKVEASEFAKHRISYTKLKAAT